MRPPRISKVCKSVIHNPIWGGRVNAVFIEGITNVYKADNALYFLRVLASSHRVFISDLKGFKGHVININSEVIFSFSSIYSIVELKDKNEVPEDATQVVSGSSKIRNNIWFSEDWK